MPMRQYELLYIIPAAFTDDEIKEIQKKVLGYIERLEGKVTRHENLGKLKLAYPIDKYRHGHYILIQFEVVAEAVAKLEKDLRLDDQVLRSVITNMLPGAAERQFELTAYQNPLTEEKPRERPTPSRPVPPVQVNGGFSSVKYSQRCQLKNSTRSWMRSSKKTLIKRNYIKYES